MSSIDNLPPDQRAVLSLVLRQGKSYDDVAGLLRIDRERVRGRALAALTELGPVELSHLPRDVRLEVGDYLLGQQTPTESEATRTLLRDNDDAREWAHDVSGQIAELSSKPLPAVVGNGAAPADEALADEPAPAAAATADEPDDSADRPAPRRVTPADTAREAFDRDARDDGGSRGAAAAATTAGAVRPRSSRRGGALLLIAAGVIVAALIIIVLQGGSHGSSTDNATVSGTATHQTSTAVSGTASASPKIDAQINFSPPPGSSSHAIAVAQIISQGSLRAFALQAEGLAPTSGYAYGVWLYNSQSDAQFLGFINQQVTSNGRASAIAPLPKTASNFHEMVVTKETAARPTQPGVIVLVGQLGSAG